MAAPVATARQAPAGKMLEEGFRSLITLSTDPDIEFWEKTVKGAGWDGGEPINITTMHNIEFFTKSPQTLRDTMMVTIKVAYDPIMYTRCREQINRRQTITELFPDGSTLAYFGFMQKFEVDERAIGAQPEATVTISPTNWDPTNDVEAAPVLVNVTGT